ncbi:hypothetical protein TW95_gp0698 [Pandoravirus inopinatum]|uniref:Uncharacterized protein n=1 Tax=Pandoravirus inopinatum TaxID=1605721 RepID=A0A0B5JCP8_9VIRU|nr:hypothetical protein TW95_gp0698 [Pandoravirus inopinatum]AJF97432.1 hypothetical protein [Pandoravirus inopinatum]
MAGPPDWAQQGRNKIAWTKIDDVDGTQSPLGTGLRRQKESAQKILGRSLGFNLHSRPPPPFRNRCEFWQGMPYVAVLRCALCLFFSKETYFHSIFCVSSWFFLCVRVL